MAELSKSQLILLDNLIYLNEVVNKKDMTVGQIVNELIYDNKLDASINEDKIGTDEEYPCNMSRGEWLAILDAINKDPQLRSLKVNKGINGEMHDKDGQPIMKNGKVLEAGMRVATFVDPDGEATVVFRGTGGDFEWFDNGQGGYLADTPQQIAALKYVESLEYDNITVTGHSKGGNKAQYVAILSDKVKEAVSFDGQGFSREFLEKYKDRIEANAHKITSISAKDDFVNCLLYPIAGTIDYIDTKEQEKFKYNHRPNILLNENGQLRGPAEQGDIPKFINAFTIYIHETMEEPFRSYAFDGVLSLLKKGDEGFAKEGWLHRWSSVAMVATHLDDYTFSQIAEEYGDGAELVVVIIASSLYPYLFTDDLIRSLSKNIGNAIDYAIEKLNQFGDWLMTMLNKAGAKIKQAGNLVVVGAAKFAERVRSEWEKLKEGVVVFSRTLVDTTKQTIEHFMNRLKKAVTNFCIQVAEGTKKVLAAIKQSWNKAVDHVKQGISNIINRAKAEQFTKIAVFVTYFTMLRELQKQLSGKGDLSVQKSTPAAVNHKYTTKVVKGYGSYTSAQLTVDFSRIAHLKSRFRSLEERIGSRVQQMLSQAERTISSTGRAYSESNVQRQIHQLNRTCEQIRQRNYKVVAELQSKVKFLNIAEEQYRKVEGMISSNLSAGVSFI
ncbi:Mbeg1-like protein [Paenibacillus lentus]|uniref:Mbeg1-like protein n=1 Tax=Paenibacillus lentus TaxID=1338368 RepID=UPI00365B1CD3